MTKEVNDFVSYTIICVHVAVFVVSGIYIKLSIKLVNTIISDFWTSLNYKLFYFLVMNKL